MRLFEHLSELPTNIALNFSKNKATLIDSHCHIDGEQFEDDRDDVVQRAKDAGVVAMLNVGTGDPRTYDFRRAVAVAERYDGVYASVGVHPHDAKLYDDAAEEHLIDLAKSPKVIAWGEIGLDHYYDHSPRDVQREVFVRQIHTAKRLGLPVIIHSRDADDETVEILTEECRRKHLRTRMSAFRRLGSCIVLAERLRWREKLMDVGFMISFAGNVTFKKAENLRESARVVPLDRLLIETDCPFLTPVPFRGKRNEPSYAALHCSVSCRYVRHSGNKAGRSYDDNFLRFFDLDLNN